MSTNSKIEWTDNTWNPIVGCSIISPGCTNCYAMRQAPRTDALSIGAPWAGHPDKLTKSSKVGPVWTGAIRFVERRLTEPLRWKKPRYIFVNSMGDLFHESIPDEWIDKIFAVMALSPQHTFQVLTKRAERMRGYLSKCPDSLVSHWLAVSPPKPANPDVRWKWPLPNVWLGVSTERQQEANARREPLAALAAAGWTTFVSYEPALGPIDWKGWEFLRWLISGGESGSRARPSHPDWHRAAHDFCAANGIAYFFKQWGEFAPAPALKPATHAIFKNGHCYRSGHVMGATDMPDAVAAELAHETGFYTRISRVGKKAAGRLLDGKEHNEFPS